MRIFVSSLIGGFGAERAVVRNVIETLRHEAIMAEDFGAQPNSPQIACLQGLRESDLVVLILGERYGQSQSSGISATHEEYREAKGAKQILAFVQEGIAPEPEQQAFIQEVEEWENGVFRQSFRSPDDLRTAVTRALHDYDMTTAHATVDVEELRQAAVSLLPNDSRSQVYRSGAMLNCGIVGGPFQQVFRAAQIEDQTFADNIQQAAQFGSSRLLSASSGTSRTIEGDALMLRQENGASLTVNERAHLGLRVPLERQDRNSRFSNEGSALVEESVIAAMKSCLEFGSAFLDEVDRTQRLAHIAVAVSISDAEYRGWITQAELADNRSGIHVSITGSSSRSPVIFDCQRPAFRLNRTAMIEDLTVRLRRQW